MRWGRPRRPAEIVTGNDKSIAGDEGEASNPDATGDDEPRVGATSLFIRADHRFAAGGGDRCGDAGVRKSDRGRVPPGRG
jgi:hypothetical protein